MTKDEALKVALNVLRNRCEPDHPVFIVIKSALEANEFNPDWDTQAVLVEEIQRMAKRIEELETKDEPVVLNEGVPAMLPKQKEGETFIVSYEPNQEARDEPVAKNEEGRITWLVDNWPQNCLLYTHPPQSFTYEQVKAHIRAASMSANDISVGSDTTEDGVSIVIRRRDELLYAEFFAYTPPQRTWVGLTDEEIFDVWFSETPAPDKVFYQKLCRSIEAKLRSKNYD